MPKYRLVNPELLMDERLMGLSPTARLYIYGAASIADRVGVLENRPFRIKLASMPHDDHPASDPIMELLSRGIFSMSEDERYLKIEPWNDWFKPWTNEPEIQQDQSFSCRTPVEQRDTSGRVPTTLREGTNKNSNNRRIVKEKEKKKEALFPVFESMDEDLKYYFKIAVEEYPTRDEGHNAKSASWETRKVQRDCRLLQSHWMALLGSGIATPKELCACALVASEDWAAKRGEYQYIPNMSTFFGPEKSLWMSYLERARAYLAKEEAK